MSPTVIKSIAAAAVMATAAVVEALPAPSGIWPVTVTGWLGLFLACASLSGVIWTAHRAGVERTRKDTLDDARMQATDERLNSFHGAVDMQLNGFGGRIEKLEQASSEDRIVVNGVLQSLAEARAHREHVGQSLQRIEATLSDVSRAVMTR